MTFTNITSTIYAMPPEMRQEVRYVVDHIRPGYRGGSVGAEEGWILRDTKFESDHIILIFVRYLEKVRNSNGDDEWLVVTNAVREVYNKDTWLPIPLYSSPSQNQEITWYTPPIQGNPPANSPGEYKIVWHEAGNKSDLHTSPLSSHDHGL